jgi:hypothetical protein
MKSFLTSLASSAVLVSMFALPASAAAPVPGVNITAIGGQDATSGAVTLNVLGFPTTVALDGVANIDHATLDGANLAFSDNGVQFYSDHYFAGIGNEDTANFTVPWTITAGGLHNVVATVTHGNVDGTDSVLVTINLNIAVNECPAAPSVAAHYLQMLGIKSGSKIFKNVISLVAGHMGPQTNFDGVKACDAGYAPVVQAYVDSHMSVAK